VHDVAARLLTLLLQAGPLGLVLIGTLDSSFLVFPLGNDMLLAALAARHPSRVPIYVVASAFGSACGVLLVDLIARKGGEKGLSRFMKPRQIERLKQKIERRAAVMLVAACLAPPPFPFTAAVVGAAGLQYPRARLLAIVFAARTARFVLVSLIAVHYGPGVLRVLQTPAFFWFAIGFAILCVTASALSLIRWIRIARRR
jgi:membrane protein YqaA with SNARE-associated domain